ncbi:MAG: DUF192 domain-containing protein [Candidatus Micrarchaeota archaeon]|nr:DUF192 domain-containing protein [Candidatus Micrarchaeota archaeon]
MKTEFLFLIAILAIAIILLIYPRKMKICLDSRCFDADIADNFIKRSIGLMFRNSISDDYAMIFFMNGNSGSFWMKNVNFPLELICIKDGSVIDIIEMDKCTTADCKRYPTPPSDYAIEVKPGFCSSRGIKVGSKLKL